MAPHVETRGEGMRGAKRSKGQGKPRSIDAAALLVTTRGEVMRGASLNGLCKVGFVLG